MEDAANAFCSHGRTERQDVLDGPLAGLTFAVKDLFDVADIPSGCGNPEWLRTHSVPKTDAAIVQAILAAGARFVGKTHMDELAWSLNGQNAHYGTPMNVAAPGRIPGGSSSGSAAATADRGSIAPRPAKRSCAQRPQQIARDDMPLDFARPVPNPFHPRIAPDPFQRQIGHQPHTTMDLQRLVRHAREHFGRV